MKKVLLALTLSMPWAYAHTTQAAGCTNCVGDYTETRTQTSFAGSSVHDHKFGAVCEAADLTKTTDEVSITLRVVADLAGATKYVSANFISGSKVVAINSGNGFKGAPKDGLFFVKNGITECNGKQNEATVRLTYADFNGYLAAGDGTVTIQLIASAKVAELCDGVTCACPPGMKSSSEVLLIYLDCDLIGDTAQCVKDTDCDDTIACNGVETCVKGLCQSSGNPCLDLGKLCNEIQTGGFSCIDCLSDADCQAEDALFCNGQETCVKGTCQVGSDPCAPTGETCNEITNACFTPLQCP